MERNKKQEPRNVNPNPRAFRPPVLPFRVAAASKYVNRIIEYICLRYIYIFLCMWVRRLKEELGGSGPTRVGRGGHPIYSVNTYITCEWYGNTFYGFYPNDERELSRFKTICKIIVSRVCAWMAQTIDFSNRFPVNLNVPIQCRQNVMEHISSIGSLICPALAPVSPLYPLSSPCTQVYRWMEYDVMT